MGLIKGIIRFLWSHKKILLLVIVALLFLVGYLVLSIDRSVNERFKTSEGFISDYINWTGRQENGTYMLFMVNIHDSGFCLRDQRMAELAATLRSMGLWVDMKFQSIYANNIFDRFLCEPSSNRSETYRVMELQLSLKARNELTPWQYNELEPFSEIIDLPPDPANQ